MIYLCIVTYNRPPAILSRCIQSLMPVLSRAHLYLLKQGCHDATPLRNIWCIPTNLGCAGGRHFLAMKLLHRGLQPDDITVWLDDDLVAEGDEWLDALIAPLVSDDADITGVEGMEVLPTFHTQPVNGRAPDYVSGGWCAIAGRVLLAGCMFDARYFPNYWEDVDLCYQARAKGFRIAQVPNMGLHHVPHAGDAAAFTESRAQFMQKWFGIKEA